MSRRKGNIILELNKIYCGDCIEVMKDIPNSSIDAIICDPPYGTTACKWDTVIPFESMWNQLRRVTKKNGAIVLFGSQPFTSALIMSNPSAFKYCWAWNKKIPSGMSYARFRPMQQTEDICVFTTDGSPTVYNPQTIDRDIPIKSGGTKHSESAPIANKDPEFKKTYTKKQPITLLEFDKVRRGSVHPTQKPVDLMEYLIKTYTNEGEVILDFAAGSCTTGVACINLNRGYILIEKEQGYCDIGQKRIEDTIAEVKYD